MGVLLRLAFVAVIVFALALGACEPAHTDAPDEPVMDGSTAGANAVTMEDLGIGGPE